MAFSTRIKSIINRGLNRIGLRLDTLTAARLEATRLERLEKAGYFDAPAFPIPAAFDAAAPGQVLEDLTRHASRFDDLVSRDRNPVAFTFDNGFFSSPDAEVLYCIIRRSRPRRIVEVGSGNSTKIMRLALRDGEIDAELCCIDPSPRVGVDDIADRVIRAGVENIDEPSIFEALGENDVLFIDSSHELRPGNDLTHLYLRVFPSLAAGVLVHIHDVFLPFDYRLEWARDERLGYTEQYLVQAMLQSGAPLEVIWPGYYLQRTMSGFSELFPHRRGRDAQSLWLRVR